MNVNQLNVNQDFIQFMKNQVIPAKNAHPSHIRLDGQESIGNGALFGYFNRYGCRWRVNKDTHYETLMLAHDTPIKDENDDPFVVKPTRQRTNLSLKLREDLKERLDNSDEYLYIYLEDKS